MHQPMNESNQPTHQSNQPINEPRKSTKQINHSNQIGHNKIDHAIKSIIWPTNHSNQPNQIIQPSKWTNQINQPLKSNKPNPSTNQNPSSDQSNPSIWPINRQYQVNQPINQTKYNASTLPLFTHLAPCDTDFVLPGGVSLQADQYQ